MNMTINKSQRLYVLKSGNGYSCLGFDVAERRRRAVLAWLGEKPEPMRIGTRKHWKAYTEAMRRGLAHNQTTGARCPADLSPRLKGLEGRRVEVTHDDGEKRRFYVGKSCGWMPVHLEIARRDSIGGGAVYLPDSATVRVLY